MQFCFHCSRDYDTETKYTAVVSEPIRAPSVRLIARDHSLPMVLSYFEAADERAADRASDLNFSRTTFPGINQLRIVARRDYVRQRARDAYANEPTNGRTVGH